MIEKRKSPKEKRAWPIKSDKYPTMRISIKGSGYGYCSFCSQKINQGDITYLIYPKLSTGIRIHINCLEGLYHELTNLRKKNIQKIMAEQLCPTIKTADQVD